MENTCHGLVIHGFEPNSVGSPYHKKRGFVRQSEKQVSYTSHEKIKLQELESIRLYCGFIPASTHALETVLCGDAKTGHM